MQHKWFNAYLYKHNPDWYPDEWKIWYDEPNDKHAWAFIHFIKSRGNVVCVRLRGDVVDIAVKEQL